MSKNYQEARGSEDSEKPKKIVIMGSGEIGSKTLLSIFHIFNNPTQQLEVMFYDRNYDRAFGHSIDVIGSIIDEPFPVDKIKLNKLDYIKVTISKNLEDDLTGADVIIYAIGVSAASLGSSYREAAIPFIYKVIKEHGKVIREKAPSSLIIMITNPVDMAVGLMHKVTGFPSDKIIGSGTELDARRFRRAFSHEIQKALSLKRMPKVEARVIGGHSDVTMIILEDSILIDGLSLEKFIVDNKITHVLMNKMFLDAQGRMKREGFEIIKLKGWGATYEPALLLASMARAYLFGGPIKMTASRYFDGAKGENFTGLSDCVLSVPLILDKEIIKIDNSIVLEEHVIKKLVEVSEIHKNLLKQIQLMPKDLIDVVIKAREEYESKAKSYENKEKLLDKTYKEYVSKKENLDKTLSGLNEFLKISRTKVVAKEDKKSEIDDSPSRLLPVLSSSYVTSPDLYSISRGKREFGAIEVSVKVEDLGKNAKNCLLRLFAEYFENAGIENIRLDEDNSILKLPNNNKCNELLSKLNIEHQKEGIRSRL